MTEDEMVLVPKALLKTVLDTALLDNGVVKNDRAVTPADHAAAREDRERIAKLRFAAGLPATP
jgi:hypothetical protein